MVKMIKLRTLPLQIQQIVSAEWWPTLLETGGVATYKKGAYVIRVGERDKYVRIGLSGWIALQRGNSILGLANRSMQTNAINKDQTPATADIVALTEVSAVLLDRNKLTEALLKSPPEGLLTLLSWSAKNWDMMAAFSAIKCCPTEIGLPALLWILSDPEKDGRRRVPDNIPERALAAMLGTCREEVNKKRRDLRTAGVLTKEGSVEFMDAMTPLLLAPHGF